ncbi:MAG: hypothetical protein US86_C0003G0088 [Candidatus Daviesbacteria bacterium GW2011_GWA2_38_24]|uniref:Uncharacterized protein n=1 Tax=Candidatus Daviesbacteria bacterium GW2011_GWA2_38_24 TaxID=1618422 RepID=A0A0G0JUW6_9BACT|nr:MAG: hypothetical protein US86_C0003G0088 [Candidatus Daviesbacteria bacterium GW2011_GWA2_38_24]KKQ80230.1 MAG: hypothetical protein UT01_C0016G0011 [Candidatus Daviesbacteria bacterium GW2011_GWA1_38_7]
MKKIFQAFLVIAYFLIGATAVITIYTLFKGSVPTGMRWLFWIIFIGLLWLIAWIVARKQGKSFSDIWKEDSGEK